MHKLAKYPGIECVICVMFVEQCQQCQMNARRTMKMKILLN